MSGASPYERLRAEVKEPHGSVSTVAAVLQQQTEFSADEAQVVAHAAKNYSVEDVADSLNVDVPTIKSYAADALETMAGIDEDLLTPPFNE